jgi:hypothetical protein
MLHGARHSLCELKRVQLLGEHEFERMSLYDVAVTSDGQRIFAVGTMIESAEGLHPSKSRKEKQIISGCRSHVAHQGRDHF